jgi:hypothetical protein
MYHPAKVEEKISTGTATAFLVTTWDENTFTLGADDSLDTSGVAEGDVVLLDYYPDDRFEMPTPRQVVTAVLGDDQADRIWTKYKELYEQSQGQQTAPMQMPNQQFEGGYIG